MAKFVIKGARKSDAQTVMFNVDALSIAEAAAKANQSGVMVESVNPIGILADPSAPPIRPAGPAPVPTVMETRGFVPPAPQAYAPPAPSMQYATPRSASAPGFFGLLLLSLVLLAAAIAFDLFALAALYAFIDSAIRIPVRSGTWPDQFSAWGERAAPASIYLGFALLLHGASAICAAVRRIGRHSWQPR